MTSRTDGERRELPRHVVPTVVDVAALAGVSPMTVSRVLSGGKNVREHLRIRVEQAVEELGYHRNENARSLRPGNRSGLVGVMITNIANPYYAQMLLGIEESAARNGRRILVGNTNEDQDLEARLVGDFTGRQVEGLIAVPSGQDRARWQPARLGHAPVVFATRAVDGLDADTVLVDDVSGAYQATLALLNEGHRRIAFLGNQLSVFTGQRRFEGFRRAHEQFVLRPVDELIRRGQQDVSSAEAAMRELMALESPPTAVFSANNRNTIGAIRAIRALISDSAGNAALFERFHLIGFDGFEFADMAPVALSIVDHDPRELGRRAGDLLNERLQPGFVSTRARVVQLPVTLRRLS